MKAGFKSYSAVVKERQSTPTIAPETAKMTVKSAVKEKDRSRSLLIFGLPEEDEESDQTLTTEVEEILREIGEKPRFEACRIGKVVKKANDTAPRIRPVKITVGSSVTANLILAQSRRLAQSKKHQKIFVSPDRSPAERAQHRALVMKLKEKRDSDPSKRYFIRDKEIITIEQKT